MCIIRKKTRRVVVVLIINYTHNPRDDDKNDGVCVCGYIWMDTKKCVSTRDSAAYVGIGMVYDARSYTIQAISCEVARSGQTAQS